MRSAITMHSANATTEMLGKWIIVAISGFLRFKCILPVVHYFAIISYSASRNRHATHVPWAMPGPGHSLLVPAV